MDNTVRSANIYDMQEVQAAWVTEIMPCREYKKTALKLAGESLELLDAVHYGDINTIESEIADCLILLLDIANLNRVDIVGAFYDKMKVNKNREWAAKNGSLTHK